MNRNRVAQYITVFTCGCEQEYKAKSVRRKCPIHKTPVSTVKSICMNCGEVYYPRSMRGAPVFCLHCKSAKEPLLTQEELETCDRIDGWDCQFRSRCIDETLAKKLPMLPCKGCEQYKHQALDINDYITATDLFANALIYTREG